MQILRSLHNWCILVDGGDIIMCFFLVIKQSLAEIDFWALYGFYLLFALIALLYLCYIWHKIINLFSCSRQEKKKNIKTFNLLDYIGQILKRLFQVKR